MFDLGRVRVIDVLGRLPSVWGQLMTVQNHVATVVTPRFEPSSAVELEFEGTVAFGEVVRWTHLATCTCIEVVLLSFSEPDTPVLKARNRDVDLSLLGGRLTLFANARCRSAANGAVCLELNCRIDPHRHTHFQVDAEEGIVFGHLRSIEEFPRNRTRINLKVDGVFFRKSMPCRLRANSSIVKHFADCAQRFISFSRSVRQRCVQIKSRNGATPCLL